MLHNLLNILQPYPPQGEFTEIQKYDEGRRVSRICILDPRKNYERKRRDGVLFDIEKVYQTVEILC
jgi:hypothetical protein